MMAVNEPDDDDLTTAEKLLEQFKRGEIGFEEVALSMMAEICHGVWCMASDTNALIEMAASDGETKH